MGGGSSLEIVSANEVADFVSNLGSPYRQYGESIRQNGVDGITVLMCFEEASSIKTLLDNLGVKDVHQIVLTSHLKRIIRGSAPPPVSASSTTQTTVFVNATISTVNTTIFHGCQIRDHITLTPREIMSKIFAIHSIDVDPTNFVTSIPSLLQIIKNVRATPKPQYDCFISYRKDSDFDLAEKIYLTLKNDGINAYLDRYCLANGENWKGEFLKALRTSRCFVPLISCAGLRSVRDIHVDHSFDNLLLEFEIALNVRLHE